MAHFKDVVETFVASRELDQASLSRLAFWVEVLGERDLAALTADVAFSNGAPRHIVRS